MAFLAPIALIAGGVGTAMSAIGQYSQMKSEANASDYNASVMRQNAEATMNQTQAQVDVIRRNNSLLESRQRVLYAKAGVQMTGTPIEVMADTAAVGELQAQQEFYSGKIAAGKYLSQADMEEMKAKQLRKMAPWAAATSLLTGASKLGMAYGSAKIPTSSPGPGYQYTPNSSIYSASGTY